MQKDKFTGRYFDQESITQYKLVCTVLSTFTSTGKFEWTTHLLQCLNSFMLLKLFPPLV